MRLPLAALVTFAAIPSSASSEAASPFGKPTTATHEEGSDSPPTSTAEGIDRYLKKKKRGKKAGKSAKNSKSTKSSKKDGGGYDSKSAKKYDGGLEDINKRLMCARRLLGENIFDDACETFVVTNVCLDGGDVDDCPGEKLSVSHRHSKSCHSLETSNHSTFSCASRRSFLSKVSMKSYAIDTRSCW